jgi:hypothetical protein
MRTIILLQLLSVVLNCIFAANIQYHTLINSQENGFDEVFIVGNTDNL